LAQSAVNKNLFRRNNALIAGDFNPRFFVAHYGKLVRIMTN